MTAGKEDAPMKEIIRHVPGVVAGMFLYDLIVLIIKAII